MAFFEESWVDAVEKLVSSSVEEQTDDEQHFNHAGVHGISNAYRHFRGIATDDQAVRLRNKLEDWKNKCLFGCCGQPWLWGGDRSPGPEKRAKPSLQVRLIRVLEMLPELFSILFSLAEVVSKELTDETQLNSRDLEKIQDGLVDSWMTKLVGSLVVLYTAWKLHPKRVFSLDPRRVDVLSTLDVSPNRVFHVVSKVLFPTMQRFCTTKRLRHLAITYIVGSSLRDFDIAEVHKFTSSKTLDNPWTGYQQDRLLHLLVRFSPTPMSSKTLLATGLLLIHGSSLDVFNAAGQTPQALANQLGHTSISEFFEEYRLYKSVQTLVDSMCENKVCETLPSSREIEDAEERILILQQDVFESEFCITRALASAGTILGCMDGAHEFIQERSRGQDGSQREAFREEHRLSLSEQENIQRSVAPHDMNRPLLEVAQHDTLSESIENPRNTDSESDFSV